jgi:hypothetical protein
MRVSCALHALCVDGVVRCAGYIDGREVYMSLRTLGLPVRRVCTCMHEATCMLALVCLLCEQALSVPNEDIRTCLDKHVALASSYCSHLLNIGRVGGHEHTHERVHEEGRQERRRAGELQGVCRGGVRHGDLGAGCREVGEE